MIPSLTNLAIHKKNTSTLQIITESERFTGKRKQFGKKRNPKKIIIKLISVELLRFKKHCRNLHEQKRAKFVPRCCSLF